jgi:type I restriction enzyme R subunit
VVSTEIVDIMKAAGFETPDISILSDEFLAEVSDTERPNLAIEALRKLINGDVRSQAKRNVTQAKSFSERLEAAIARYHTNALTTAQVLEELIHLAKDIRAARLRGEESGLTDEEIASTTPGENESARELMGEPALRVIAHELVQAIKANVTVDWMHRQSARANIRRHVKRLLRKYGYPPDLQDAAFRMCFKQAEALSASGRRSWRRRSRLGRRWVLLRFGPWFAKRSL